MIVLNFRLACRKAGFGQLQIIGFDRLKYFTSYHGIDKTIFNVW
jgi:hypothetical protein